MLTPEATPKIPIIYVFRIYIITVNKEKKRNLYQRFKSSLYSE